MLICAIFFFCIPLSIGAQESTASVEMQDLPKEYAEMLAQLPEALRDSLPSALFTSDPEEAARAWQALTSPRALFSLLIDSLTGQWRSYLLLFMELCGVILLRAVMQCLHTSLHTPMLQSGMQLLCRVVLFSVILTGAMQSLAQVTTFYGNLQELTAAFLPLMGSMYALGGNVGAAVANHSTLVLTLTLIEWMGGRTVLPLFSLCLAFSVLGVFSSGIAGRMQVVTSKLKKWYTTAIALTMLILSTSLGAQTTLAAMSDSLAFRTVRFAISSGIPMVGGNIAEMLRTAASGVSWMRGVVGMGGVVLLLWLLLPQILSLWMTRLLYSLAGDVAHWFGCGEEGGFLSEIAGLFGYLLAIVALSAMTFLLSLLLLMKCGAAYGG